MQHVEFLKSKGIENSNNLITKASGRYYTGEFVGRRLANILASSFLNHSNNIGTISIIDPFGGDGRLVQWMLEEFSNLKFTPKCYIITLWDIDESGCQNAKLRLDSINIDVETDIKIIQCDSFNASKKSDEKFDIVITNPPWELLKPDRRETYLLNDNDKSNYIEHLRSYDSWLAKLFPLAQPKSKFAGWGTNLSRVGLELCLSLVQPGGSLGIVLPASLLADDQSTSLRKHLLCNNAIEDIAYFPAESKHYGNADVDSITIVAKCHNKPNTTTSLTSYSSIDGSESNSEIHLDLKILEASDFVLPVSFGAEAIELLNTLSARFPKWIDLESNSGDSLWAGREIDETGSEKWLGPLAEDRIPFVKGKMIDRYIIREELSQAVYRDNWIPPSSLKFHRIVWRDVSRPNQKRRIIATMIPPGCTAGNSLGVAFFKNNHGIALHALLGIINSTVFEFQLRAHLATGHVSLPALRKVSLPNLRTLQNSNTLAALVAKALDGDNSAESTIDAYVAKEIYKLNIDEYSTILSLFPKLTKEEQIEMRSKYDAQYDLVPTSSPQSRIGNQIMITPKLFED
jgi:Alw26I/Eco31I/Esp3I family type II restriction m6 adenine DNA methyltransferase